MASIATAATRAEIVTLSNACLKLEIALRKILDGSGTAAYPGQLSATEVDTLITAVSSAITAATS